MATKKPAKKYGLLKSDTKNSPDGKTLSGWRHSWTSQSSRREKRGAM